VSDGGGIALHITSRGDVAPGAQQSLVDWAEECLRRLDGSFPRPVDLRFFDTVERQKAEDRREQQELGIVAGEPLPVGHSAWGDTPRISVCIELLDPLPPLVRQGMVHVAVSHALLHGSAEYYAFRIPGPIVQQGRLLAVSSDLLQLFLYQVARAVKGRAAVQWLVTRGLIAPQIALAMYELQPTAEDSLAWLLAQSDGRTRALCWLEGLRPLLCAQPLLPFAPALGTAMHASLEYMSTEDRSALERLSLDVTTGLQGDTRSDIQRAFSTVWEHLTEQMLRREPMA
jgi:hypothetical protein